MSNTDDLMGPFHRQAATVGNALYNKRAPKELTIVTAIIEKKQGGWLGTLVAGKSTFLNKSKKVFSNASLDGLLRDMNVGVKKGFKEIPQGIPYPSAPQQQYPYQPPQQQPPYFPQPQPSQPFVQQQQYPPQQQMKSCPRCGLGLSVDAPYCYGCGTSFVQLPTQAPPPTVAPQAPPAPVTPQAPPQTPAQPTPITTIWCGNCGASLIAGKRFCTKCGTKLE